MLTTILRRTAKVLYAIALTLIVTLFCHVSKADLDLLGQVPLSSNDAHSPDYEQTIARLRHPDNKTLQSLMELVRDVRKDGNQSTNSDDRLLRIYRAFEIIGTNATPLIPELRREFLAENACAAYGLVQIGGDAWRVLSDGLTNSDVKVQISAAMAMSYASDTNAVSALPYLKSFLTNNSPTMRSVAATSLGHLSVSANSKLPSLIQSAKTDTNAVVRSAAVMAIANTGTNSAEVQGVLKQISESDNNESVRFAAMQAIKRLDKATSSSQSGL